MPARTGFRFNIQGIMWLVVVMSVALALRDIWWNEGFQSALVVLLFLSPLVPIVLLFALRPPVALKLCRWLAIAGLLASAPGCLLGANDQMEGVFLFLGGLCLSVTSWIGYVVSKARLGGR